MSPTFAPTISRRRQLAPWIAEARALLSLAWPLAASQLAQMAVMTTDIVMLGRLSKEALAGSALGMTVFYFAFLIGMGPATAVSPMIAHILGADGENRTGVRAVVRMGLWVVVLLTLPLMGALMFARPILLAFGQDPALAAAAGRFVLPLSFGLPFALGFQVLRNFATALHRPKAQLVVMMLTIAFNAIADYVLIFGHFGASRLGLFGSGIASACSYTFSFVAMLGVILATPQLNRFRILSRFAAFDWAKFAELFRLGIPIGVTMIFEVALFNAAVLLMGRFGTESLAAHQIVVNFASITFMVPLGLGMAATVRVGMAAGAEDRAGVRRAGYTALAMAATFMSVCATLIALMPDAIAGLYFSAANASNAGAIAKATQFLKVAAAFQIFDGIQVTSALVLRGLKDATVPMGLAAGCYWLLGFPVCYLLSTTWGMGGLGVWIGLACALFMAALLLSGRFYLLSRR